jgi:hypothetical protein
MPTIQRVSHGLVPALVFEVVGISKEILNILACRATPNEKIKK